jgi:predicted TIM-barrel fold metal-dependent hydrolase
MSTITLDGWTEVVMIIDVHVHPFCKEATITPNLEEGIMRQMGALKDPARIEPARAMLTELFTRRSVHDIVKDMDAAGVDKACIVGMDLSTHYGVQMVTDEDLPALTALYPDRFIPFVSVDPSLGSEAVDRLVHAVEKLGCRGLKLVPPVQQFDISAPKHDPLWEAALGLDIVVWTHCAHQRSHPDSDARWGAPMLVEPVAHKYPDLKIVLGHCGFPWQWEAWSLVVRHPNVYVDISAFAKLYNHMPWDAYSKFDAEHKVLFASDNPLFGFQETLEALDAVDISPEFKAKIKGENAVALLGL